jgi:hypothetical protein
MDPISTAAQLVDPFQVLASFNFWIIALANLAVLTAVKQATKVIGQAWVFNYAIVDVALTFLPLLLGGALGLLVLDQYPDPGLKFLVGLTAGFLNPFAFKVLQKIPFLEGVLVTSSDPARQEDQED